MTRRTIRASAAALCVAALLAVTGCGGSAAPATTSGATPAGAQQQQPRAGGPFSQANMSALAKDLGVSTTRLQQALAAARPAGAPNGARPSGQQGSGAPPAGGRGGQMAATLAEQLNLPTAKVQAALAKVLPGRPQGAATTGASGN